MSKSEVFNFRFDAWNDSNGDHMADQRFVITAKEDVSIVHALCETKRLCENCCIIDAAGDDSDEYTVDEEGNGTNPLNSEGDNPNTLLRIAKSIGKIEDYKPFVVDCDVDYDEEL